MFDIRTSSTNANLSISNFPNQHVWSNTATNRRLRAVTHVITKQSSADMLCYVLLFVSKRPQIGLEYIGEAAGEAANLTKYKTNSLFV